MESANLTHDYTDYPPDEIFERGINYSIKFTRRKKKDRYVFIPFEEIKEISFRDIPVHEYKTKLRTAISPFGFLFFIYPFGNRGLQRNYALRIKTKKPILGFDEFYLDFSLVRQSLSLLKKAIGQDAWDVLLQGNDYYDLLDLH